MKRTLIALLAFVVAMPALAQQPQQADAKQALINELLGVLKAEGLSQSLFDRAFERRQAEMAQDDYLLPAEQRETAKATRTQRERAMREKVHGRVDYAKYVRDTYAHALTRGFSEQELRDLLAFYRTSAGQKSVTLIAEQVVRALETGGERFWSLSNAVHADLAREEAKANPARATLESMRLLSGLVQTYALDNGKYPQAASIRELKEVLAASGYQNIPEKDAWGNNLLYSVSPDGTRYRIVSPGSDKQLEATALTIVVPEGPFATRNNENDAADIILQDGEFVQRPAAN